MYLFNPYRLCFPKIQVAEMRQLKEEEAALLNGTVRTMEHLYVQIQGLRRQQGYSVTNLELTVQSKPPQELSWQQVRRTVA